MRTRPTHMIALAAALLLALPLAGVSLAQPPSVTGDYDGDATAKVLDVTAGDFPDAIVLADVDLAPTAAAADTTGGLTFRDEEDLTAYGVGTNIALSLLGEINADLIVEAVQTAPPDNPEPAFEQLLEIPADPLLTLELATAEAWARDVGTDACPANGGVVAFGASEVTNAQLFPDALDPDVHVLDVNDVVNALSELSLVPVDGQDTFGVQALATSDIANLTLFGEVEIAIASPPILTATATGTPGTASVDYHLPLVTINGEGLTFDEPIDVPIGDPSLGFLARIQFGQFTEDVAADGTSASGTATLLEITLLQSLGDPLPEFTIANIEVAPLTARATAPEGGVACDDDNGVPPDNGIDVDVEGPDEVDPGAAFDYTATVTNNLECPVVNATITFEITGPEGSEVIEVDPDDGTIDGLTVVWERDELAPGASETFRVRVQTPEDATPGDSFEVVVTVEGECEGEPVEGEGSFTGPTIRDDDVTPVDPKAPPRDDVDPRLPRLPETGGGLALLALLSLGAAGALRLRG
jgi:hypothetical protein